MKIKNGYIYLIIFLILDGLFPIFSYFAMQEVSTLWIVSIATGISFIAGLVVLLKQKLYIQYNKKDILIPTLLSVIFMGNGGLLYFFGIKYSSPSIAAILLLLQSLFAFIVFNLIGKEDYNFKQIIGAILMFLGGVIILYKGDSFINLGALIMIIAGISWTIGNFFTKKASLKGASAFFLLINRNLFMFMLTTILAFIFVGKPNLDIIGQNIIWIFLIGFLVLFIGKASWITALSKLNSFVAISSFSIIPLLVLIFSYFILGQIPDAKQILGFIPIFIGSFMLIKK